MMENRSIWWRVIGLLFSFCVEVIAAEPHKGSSAGFDVRSVALSGSEASVAPARKDAENRMRARVHGLRIDHDLVTGSPKFIGSRDGFLTGRDGLSHAASSSFLKAIPASDRHRTVKAFLNEHRSVFGYGGEVLDGAKVDRDETGKHNGMRTVVWRQMLDNIPVFDGIIKVHVARNGELVNIGSQFVMNTVAAADKGAANRLALRSSPVIASVQAVSTAAHNIEEPVEATELTVLDEATGPEKVQHFKHPRLIDPCARLVWFPLDATTLRLCWDVVLMSNARREMYRVLVDAENGAIVLNRSLTADLTDASYRVFTSDSPSPFSPGWTTPNSGQPAVIPQALVTTPALDTTLRPMAGLTTE